MCLSLSSLLAGLLVGLSLGLVLASLSLLDEELLALSLGLLGVDGFHQDTLVLELVTLAAAVELVVEVLVDLLSLAVLAKETTQDTLSSHPEDLERHTSVAGTLSLTKASVATLGLGSHEALMSSLGVDSIRSLDNEAILDQLADVLSAVGQANVGGLVRVQPHLVLTNLQHGGC